MFGNVGAIAELHRRLDYRLVSQGITHDSEETN